GQQLDRPLGVHGRPVLRRPARRLPRLRPRLEPERDHGAVRDDPLAARAKARDRGELFYPPGGACIVAVMAAAVMSSAGFAPLSARIALVMTSHPGASVVKW